LKKDLLLKYIKTKLISLFNLDNIDPVITIWEWDYIQLKSNTLDNPIVLWRVLKIHMRELLKWKYQVCYDIEIFRSSNFIYIDVQDIFNWKIKLQIETHDIYRVNKDFEKINFIHK
jgi:hypothetical protein